MINQFTANDNGSLFYSPDTNEVGYLEYPLTDRGGAPSKQSGILWVHGGTGWYYVEPFEVQRVVIDNLDKITAADALALKKEQVWPDQSK